MKRRAGDCHPYNLNAAQVRVLRILSDGKLHYTANKTTGNRVHAGTAMALQMRGYASPGDAYNEYSITRLGRAALRRAMSK